MNRAVAVQISSLDGAECVYVRRHSDIRNQLIFTTVDGIN